MTLQKGVTCRYGIQLLKTNIHPKFNAGVTPLHHGAQNGCLWTYQLIINMMKNPENVARLTPLDFVH